MEKIRNSIKPFNQEEVIKAFMGASYCRNMMWKNSEFISSKIEMIFSNTFKEYNSTVYFNYKDFKNIQNVVDEYFNDISIENFLKEASKNQTLPDKDRINRLVELLTNAKYLFYRKEGNTVIVLEFGKKLFANINPQIKKICGFDYNDLEKLYLYVSKKYLSELEKMVEKLDEEFKEDKWKVYAFEYFKREMFNIEKEELYIKFGKKVINSILDVYSYNKSDNYNSINEFNDILAHPILNYENYIIMPDIRYGITNLPKLFNYTILSITNNNDGKYSNEECKEIKSKYSQIRGDGVEDYVANCFDKALAQKAKIYKSLKYGKNKEFEADITVVFEKYVILCECKGKLMTLSALQGNYEKILNDFNSGIQNAYNQSCRSENYIKLGSEFYHNSSVVKIDKSYKVIKMCITAENFGYISSCPIFLLKNVSTNGFPIIYSVYDLGLVTDQLKDINLIEYLINRQDKSSALLTIEESDNLANYLKKRKIDIDKSYVEIFEEYVKNCSV